VEDFNQHMSRVQAHWREDHIVNQQPGEQNGKEYTWILPRHLWDEGLWSGIRSDQSTSLPAYLEKTGVRKHDGAHNLKSSWVLCANLYFPFRQDPALIAGFLKEHVSRSIEGVEKIELEYEDEDTLLKPTPLLGEPQGQRGRNQTSPDVAFVVTLTGGKKGLVLTEVKFTEHSFYPCSGRKKKYGNPDRRRCMDFGRVYSDPANQCYQLHWADGQRTNRKYWDYLRFTADATSTLRRCPAATAGYQLFRQQALAEALARKGPYGLVVSSVAYDARNETLLRCLHGTGIEDFATGWGPLFDGQARFSTFTHQQWVRWVEENDTSGKWKHWLDYVETRYRFNGDQWG